MFNSSLFKWKYIKENNEPIKQIKTFKGPNEMDTTMWQKTIAFNLIDNVRMCFSSSLIQYWNITPTEVHPP